MWTRRLFDDLFRKRVPIDPTLAPEDPLPEGKRLPELQGSPIKFGPVKVLSVDPPIFLSGISYDEYVGVARSFGRRYGNVKAGFIIFPTWTIEPPERAAGLRAAYLAHVARYPKHRLYYICNTAEEAQGLENVGQAALFLNHKFTVSEEIFRPLPEVPVEFDAIYNARFVSDKRHELAAELDKVAYLAYSEPQATRQKDFRTLWPQTHARCPSHVLLNDLSDGLPVRKSPEEVNFALARSETGLILSEVEGASYAAMEYMLAGLPVVSTPSVGGRHVYFDPDYTITCQPDPRSVREAVTALKQRQIPREFIRKRTLEKIAPERRRFLELVNDISEELGGDRRVFPAWPYGNTSGVPWGGFNTHLDNFDKSRIAILEREYGLDSGALSGVQLTSGELQPVLDAIASTPRCRLLVFGCGHDSRLWEKANTGGRTVFLEDNPQWAQKARDVLVSSKVYDVHYGTRQHEWKSLLKYPRKLKMQLPRSVRKQRWDVILIDGPAGYRGDLPGRMKSIYEASRLASYGAKVFVHDCERPTEEAFADRYLGRHRKFVEVSGRALLRGYAR